MEATNEARYSAREMETINRMRERYAEKTSESDKVDELNRLDRIARTHGQWQAISIGILGMLILGTGMSMVMAFSGALFVPGIFVGVIGAAIAGVAYPVFKNMNEKKKSELSLQIRTILEDL